MADLIASLEQEVKEARRVGDISALLTIATAAIEQLQAAAAGTVDSAKLLNAAKRIAYNAAADAWPGWEIGMKPRSAAELQSARSMAGQCKSLTDRLDATPMQRGNAIWLIGAFDLARGRYDDAIGQFSSAASAFAGETEMVLMAQGYCAIASECSGAGAGNEFDAVIEELTAIASEDAQETKQQLLTAREIFVKAK